MEKASTEEGRNLARPPESEGVIAMSLVENGIKNEARFPEDVAPSRVATTARHVSPTFALELYRTMALIREIEDAIQPLYNAGEIYGTTHLCSGEEAICVGVCSVLDARRDRIAATYRGHGHSIALGSDPQSLLDELFGRATGTSGGRAGSMNIIDLQHGLMGCFGIVGGSIAAATGAALALKGSGAIAVAFFGDGAANQAYFHECLNFAAVFELPVMFVCENNLYGEFTPWEQVTAGEISARPMAMGIPTVRLDGNDIWEVRDCATGFVGEMRSKGGPRFIEAITYRLGGHSRSDQATYRPPGELDAWKVRDPLVLERAHLTDELGVDSATLAQLDTEIRSEVAAMVEHARAAPWPVSDAAPTEFAP